MGGSTRHCQVCRKVVPRRFGHRAVCALCRVRQEKDLFDARRQLKRIQAALNEKEEGLSATCSHGFWTEIQPDTFRCECGVIQTREQMQAEGWRFRWPRTGRTFATRTPTERALTQKEEQ